MTDYMRQIVDKKPINQVEAEIMAELRADPHYGWMFEPYPEPRKPDWLEWALMVGVCGFPPAYVAYCFLSAVWANW